MLNFSLNLRVNFSQIVNSVRRSFLVGWVAITLLFTGLTVAPAQAAPAFSADRGSDVTRASDTTYKGGTVIQTDGQEVNPVTAETVEKIKREAEDLGDSPSRPIGETGLKNLRKLGENIPETAKLKAKQTKEIYTSETSDKALEKNPLEQVKDKIEDVVESLK
jgi:hypothetical protein